MRPRSSRGLLAVLVVACLSLITLDRAPQGSPLDVARAAVATVVGPLQSGTATAVRPFRSATEGLRTNRGLRHDVARLEAENSTLRGELAQTSLVRVRAAELRGLARMSRRTGRTVVPARVVAIGPALSFSRVVSIDVGRSDGVEPDLTVLDRDGLVGRVVSAGAHAATVLLAVDADSVVGARLGTNQEIGFLRGRGELGDAGRLDLELVDSDAPVRPGDLVTTWGSRGGEPYVADVPVGVVESVRASTRQLAQQAVVRPLVDFSSLDLVGVVVAARPGHRTPVTGDAAAERP